VVGDYYAAEWVTSAWRRENIAYIQSKLNASQLYIEALPAFTRGLVSLPDHPTLLRELRLLERSPTRMGKELVTHPRGCHDDHANSCCAVLHNLSSGVGYDLETLRRAFSTDDNPDPEAQRRVRDQQYRNEFAMRIFQLSGGTSYVALSFWLRSLVQQSAMAGYQRPRWRHLRALPQRFGNPSPSSLLSEGMPRTSARPLSCL
jgi:hypothetical protein